MTRAFFTLDSNGTVEPAFPRQLQERLLITDMIVAEHHVVCRSARTCPSRAASGEKLLCFFRSRPRRTFLNMHPQFPQSVSTRRIFTLTDIPKPYRFINDAFRCLFKR